MTEDPSDEGKLLTDEGKSHYVRNSFQTYFTTVVTEDPSDEGKLLTDEGKSHYVRNSFQNVFYYSSDRRSIR